MEIVQLRTTASPWSRHPLQLFLSLRREQKEFWGSAAKRGEMWKLSVHFWIWPVRVGNTWSAFSATQEKPRCVPTNSLAIPCGYSNRRAPLSSKTSRRSRRYRQHLIYTSTMVKSGFAWPLRAITILATILSPQYRLPVLFPCRWQPQLSTQSHVFIY